ncbi:glycosyltransferase family 2 protein [Pedobacter terrae]|uniref:glycosyltransferase family 2 protein n=1 Tax=Pedobacter terrae TaxID=405671 RepID=UPI002FF7E6ED
MECSVIIVNYNTKELTMNCLQSIRNWSSDISYEVILVDNASNDGSQELFSNEFPEINLILSPVNLGFGRANNLGASKARGKYLFFLNSDTFFINNAIKIFIDFFDSHQTNKLGCLGAELLDEKLMVNGTGGKFPRLKTYLASRIHAISAKFADQPVENSFPTDVEYVLGADMFMSRDLFLDIGGFDESYFMYYEEADLQLRISRMGYTNIIIKGPRIVHLEGKSSSVNVSVSKIIMVQKSAFTYFRKNRPYWEYLSLRVISFIDAILMLFKPGYPMDDFKTYFRFNLKKSNT